MARGRSLHSPSHISEYDNKELGLLEDVTQYTHLENICIYISAIPVLCRCEDNLLETGWSQSYKRQDSLGKVFFWEGAFLNIAAINNTMFCVSTGLTVKYFPNEL